jgi:hypothetical protein
MATVNGADDYCDACEKNVANHETESGLLCDECYVQIYTKEEKALSKRKEKRMTTKRKGTIADYYKTYYAPKPKAKKPKEK